MVLRMVFLVLALLPAATGQALRSPKEQVLVDQLGHGLHEGNLDASLEDYSSSSHVKYSSAGNEFWKSILGAGVGCVLVCLTPVALWHNELQHVKMFKLFARAKKICVPAESHRDKDHDDCLIHVNAETETPETLELQAFPVPVKVSHSLKLKATVCIYAWKERSKEHEEDTATGGKRTWTEYFYERDWVDEPADTGNFHDLQKFQSCGGTPNPRKLYKSEELVVKDAYLGTKKEGYRLNTELVGKLSNWEPLDSSELKAVSQLTVKRDPGGFTLSKPFQTAASVILDGSTLYTGPPQSPEIGDLKIEFLKVPCGEATLMAVQQKDNQLIKMLYTQAWQFVNEQWRLKRTPKGKSTHSSGSTCCKCGHGSDDEEGRLLESDSEFDLEHASLCTACDAVAKLVESGTEIYFIEHEHLEEEQVFEKLESKQNLRHTLIQFVGFCSLWLGFFLMFAVFPAVFRFIPLIGTYMQSLGNFLVGIVAFVLALVLWSVTVGISWLVARPVKGILCLVLAALCIAVPFIVVKFANPGDVTTTTTLAPLQ